MSDKTNSRSPLGPNVEKWLYDLTDSLGDETVWSRISRECSMIADGARYGITNGIYKSLRDPGDLIVKAGVAGLISVPAFALTRMPPPLCFLPEAATMIGTLALMSDGQYRMRALGAAVQDYWNNPQNREADSAMVSCFGGPLVMDAFAAGLGFGFAAPRVGLFLREADCTLKYWGLTRSHLPRPRSRRRSV